jgi:poly(3-hydroxybutyrate) depolymerase
LRISLIENTTTTFAYEDFGYAPHVSQYSCGAESMNRFSTRFPIGLLVVTLLLVCMPLALHGQSQQAEVPVFGPGIHFGILSRPGDLSVGYAISIPERYSSATPVPLILALHYGGSPNGAAQGVLVTLVQPALAELGAIIVAPQSVGGAWNTAANDRAVKALLDAVRAKYAIDPKRVAVTGYSMGGTGAWYFAGKYPETFSVAIPVAGMPPASANSWKTPVFAVHSRTDEVMPFEPTARRIKELQNAGVRAELVSLNGISHAQTNRFVSGLRSVVPWVKSIWK